jgi:hypothetical protein
MDSVAKDPTGEQPEAIDPGLVDAYALLLGWGREALARRAAQEAAEAAEAES